MATTPADDYKFSFGLWTVGWTARDQFGEASRPELEPWDYLPKLKEVSASGVTFHDDDVAPSAPMTLSVRSTSADSRTRPTRSA